MKKLCIISKKFEINGISSVIVNIIKNIDLSKIDVSICFLGEPSEKYVEMCGELNVSLISLGSKKDKAYIKNLFNFLKKEKFDIVHIHGSSCVIFIEAFLAKFCGCKKVITHSHNTTCEHKILHFLLKPLLNITANYKIACGIDAGKWMYGNKKFQVINNGIDIERFRYDNRKSIAVKKEYNLKDFYLIGHIGRVNPQKNQLFLLDIFERVAAINDNVALMFVGYGADFEKLKSSVNKSAYKDRIILIGETTEPNKFYNAFDCFALPSLCEGLPVVLIEAQANGLNCIVSDVVTTEVNMTNCIEFVSLENKDKWVNIINKMIFNKNNREEISKINCNKLIENKFDTKSNISVLENIYLSD